MAKAPEKSPLAEAAAALDAELRRYHDLSAQARKIPLDSQKNLERAGKALGEAANAQERVAEHVRTLVQAIQHARESQQTAALSLSEHAEQIASRTRDLADLLERFAELGEEAKQVNARMQEAAQYKRDPYAPDGGELGTHLADVHDRMEKVADGAKELAERANEKDLQDVGRQAESLRQQILSAKNRLSLLQKTVKG